MMKFKIPTLGLRLNLAVGVAQPRVRLIPSRWIIGAAKIVFCHWKRQCQTPPFFFFFFPSTPLPICSSAKASRIIKWGRAVGRQVGKVAARISGGAAVSLNCTLPLPFTPFQIGADYQKGGQIASPQRLDGSILRHCADGHAQASAYQPGEKKKKKRLQSNFTLWMGDLRSIYWSRVFYKWDTLASSPLSQTNLFEAQELTPETQTYK